MPVTDRMKEISTYIAEGAMAFLKAEWKILGYFVVIVGIIAWLLWPATNPHSHWSIAVAFIIGAVFSATAGYIGMKVATKANVRTAQAARTSLSKALSCFIYRWLSNGTWCCRSCCIRIRRFIYCS